MAASGLYSVCLDYIISIIYKKIKFKHIKAVPNYPHRRTVIG